MNALDTIEVEISVELGSAIMPVHRLLRMGRGAVIELDATQTDPLRIYANNTQVAEGEVRVEDGRLTIEITRKTAKRV